MSDLDADRDKSRGRVAIILAVVFLAILGSAVGVILGTGANRDTRDNHLAADQTEAVATPTVTVTSTPPNDPGNGANPKSKAPTQGKTWRQPSAHECPEQTTAELGRSASLAFYIQTDRSEVWICQADGTYYYQGHVRGKPFTAATSDHSILVPNVHREDGDSGVVYEARNGATTYYVTAEQLTIDTNGMVTREPVRAHHGEG